MTGLEKSKAITEIIKNIAEMIALIITGLWAFLIFRKQKNHPYCSGDVNFNNARGIDDRCSRQYWGLLT